MGIRVVGGGGAVVREAARLLAARGVAMRVEGHVLLDADDAERARAALREARARRNARVVLLSSLAADRAPRLPQYRPASELRKALEDSGLPFTVLLPNPLYQDDLASWESIVERGIYPLPIGPRGMSRVDARDVAEAAVRALLESGHEGRTYPLVGPEALTLEEVIEHYRHALGRDLRASEGGGRLADRYRPFRETGLRASCEDFARMDRILGRPPRPFGMFVREAVEEWRGSGAS